VDKNVELVAALRRAAQQSDNGADALNWRELLEGAANEIERLRALQPQEVASRSE
jgi:hypothetical protein